MQGGYNHSNVTIIVHYFHKDNTVSQFYSMPVLLIPLYLPHNLVVSWRLDSFVSCFQNASPFSSRVSWISNVLSEDKSDPKIDFTKVPDSLTEKREHFWQYFTK